MPLYGEIYQHGNRNYWEILDREMRQLAKEKGLLYLRDDDSVRRPFNEPPIIVNYFYHEEIKQSAKKKNKNKNKKEL